MKNHARECPQIKIPVAIFIQGTLVYDQLCGEEFSTERARLVHSLLTEPHAYEALLHFELNADPEYIGNNRALTPALFLVCRVMDGASIFMTQ